MTESERQQKRYNWLTTAQVAERCGGVTTGQVLGWVRNGLLPAHDARSEGARRPDYRYSEAEVDAFWRTRRVNGAAA